MSRTRNNPIEWWIATALLVLTLAVYSQVRSHEFLNYDDPEYVTANARVRDGITRGGLVWAFTSAHDANWIPLTWISHMLDCQVFGVRSGAQHWVNVALHSVSVLLLFLLLMRMTGARWRSAFVAFVFALHPLHIESVAWIAERKDVLFALYWLLALWAYLKYVERPSVGSYLMVVLLLCCGLMSKPMMVTWPFAMLLLDWWPLQRMLNRRLIVEKIPLIALSVTAALIAYLVQQHAGTVAGVDAIPLGVRLENAAVSYVVYLGQFVWPARLSVLYPYIPPVTWQWIGSVVALAGVSYFVAQARGKYPYLGVGWLWFLVTLAPVIGLVQVGVQAHADRYMYIPLIGITFAVAWGAVDSVRSRRSLQSILPIAGGAICAVWLGLTWVNLDHWRNSIALFGHAVEVTEGNSIAYSNLGVALRDDGRLGDAVEAFRKAAALRGEDAHAQDNLGTALLAAGNAAEAIPYLDDAVRLRPDFVKARVDLGSAYVQLGRVEAAVAQYRRAVELQPANAEANYGLGGILIEQGREAEARPYLEASLPQAMESVRLKPDDADSHYNLGRLLGILGRTDEAIAQFSEAVRLRPGDPAARVNLGIALAGGHRLNEALAQFGAAVHLAPGYVNAHFNLAGTLAASGRVDEAIGEYTETLRLQPDFAEAQRGLDECTRRRGK